MLRGRRGKEVIGGMSYKSPLESYPFLTRDEHERMNQSLHDERKDFMRVLSMKEKERKEIEWSAAVSIQKIARGYFVRGHKSDLMVAVRLRHDVCEVSHFVLVV